MGPEKNQQSSDKSTHLISGLPTPVTLLVASESGNEHLPLGDGGATAVVLFALLSCSAKSLSTFKLSGGEHSWRKESWNVLIKWKCARRGLGKKKELYCSTCCSFEAVTYADFFFSSNWVCEVCVHHPQKC